MLTEFQKLSPIIFSVRDLDILKALAVTRGLAASLLFYSYQDFRSYILMGQVLSAHVGSRTMVDVVSLSQTS